MKKENKNSGRKKKQIDTTFAKKLTMLLDEIKEKKGIVQKDVAQVVGVSRQALGKWATGETVPDVLDLVKLSNCFGVSADYLLGLSDVPSLDTNIQAVCEFTGLSEKAIENIVLINEQYRKHMTFEDFVKLSETDKRIANTLKLNPEEYKREVVYPTPMGTVLNKMIESDELFDLIFLLGKMEAKSEKDVYLELDTNNVNFESDFVEKWDLLKNKNKLNDECDFIVFKIMKKFKSIIEQFDKRKGYKGNINLETL